MGRTTSSLLRTLGIDLWIAFNTTCPSLRFWATFSLIKKATAVCRNQLMNLPTGCLEYRVLLEKGYMKERHWTYAITMAAMESLPLLYKECTKEEISHSVLAKACLGTSSKLLDNLNDEVHTVEEAHDSLENYLCALTRGTYERKERSPVKMAESSACELASWIYHSLDHRSPAFTLYLRDCAKLVKGQVSSLQHKSTDWPSLEEYVNCIAEKSIGDVWIDIDLCQIDLNEGILLLKKSNEYIFKASLLYDDVQDLLIDIRTKSVNSALLLALERGVVSEEDLKLLKPEKIAEILENSGILDYIIHLADAFFLKGVTTFMKMETESVDKKGLLQSFRLVRLFNLRKVLLRNRDVKTIRWVLASFSNLASFKDQIPEEICCLVR